MPATLQSSHYSNRLHALIYNRLCEDCSVENSQGNKTCLLGAMYCTALF